MSVRERSWQEEFSRAAKQFRSQTWVVENFEEPSDSGRNWLRAQREATEQRRTTAAQELQRCGLGSRRGLSRAAPALALPAWSPKAATTRRESRTRTRRRAAARRSTTAGTTSRTDTQTWLRALGRRSQRYGSSRVSVREHCGGCEVEVESADFSVVYMLVVGSVGFSVVYMHWGWTHVYANCYTVHFEEDSLFQWTFL